ncbi:MAG: type II toxin-antitoxin system VapC family toxin [Desulfobacteraceae bacterium]|nr:MAG: type II toxin-antitoxin system VapC family toxin [Desulfobacteraceae bacterium]
MKVLLDTHAFLWLVTGDYRLSEMARQTFLNTENMLFFSAASLWEICIKISLGKISLKRGWLQTIQDEMVVNAIQWLPIEMPHCAELTKLPFHHRDPFDRLLIAQAMVEDMQLLSRDTHLSAYAIKRVW